MAQRLLTVKDAAKRVEKTTRTIENWIRDGLVVRYKGGGDRRRYVDEVELLEMFRAKLVAARGSKWARVALRKETD